ncbi:MAG TPA: hypothetical protein VNW46_06270 [Gemmatimonadaceae bacterium]|jgi:ABC-type transport system involved in multi-copper enzyme maturation permease subunit|nr:hypothetical protein [Gemmatimonadaceae bacterium]
MSAVMEMAEVEAAPRPTARLGRYAVWQLYDYGRGVGGATVVLSGLAITMLTMTSLWGLAHTPIAQGATSALLGVLGFLGPIFACSGLVSEDRSKGYYRFLLAKPVSPVRFYAQAFLLRGAAFLGITAAVWAACALLLGTGSFIGTMAYAALCYLTVGGVTLLNSTLGRHAWLATLLLGGAAGIVTGFTRTTSMWRPLWLALHAVLPPFHLTSVLSQALMRGGDVLNTAGVIAWFAGYGLLAVAAALTVIRGREWPL